MTDVTFDQALDFTRASIGTYYDAQGVLLTAAADEERLTHDPETGAALGLLIEGQRTNLLLWSEDFTQASWSNSGTIVSSNAVSAPDGNLAADKLIPTGEGARYISANASVPDSTDLSISIFAKAGEYPAIRINTRDKAGSFSFADIDLIAGNIIAAQPELEVEIIPLADGWLRIAASRDSGIGEGDFTCYFYPHDGAGVPQGDGTSGIYIWGGQLEQGSIPSSYIKTEASQATRAVDNCSRVLGSEYSSSQGTLTVTAEAPTGSVVARLGAVEVVADTDTAKTYIATYTADPSATALELLPGGFGTIKSVEYKPEAN